MSKPREIQPDHVQTVINAPAARPWGEVNHVMVSLMSQMQQQEKQRDAAPAPKETDDKGKVKS